MQNDVLKNMKVLREIYTELRQFILRANENAGKF